MKSVIWILPSVLAITNWEVFISEELLRKETYEIWISNRNVLRTLLFSCFIVPVAEEILFRGVLIGYVSRKVNIWVAIFISSIIFVFVQFDNPVIIFAAGFMFALLYKKANSLIPSILAHLLWNIIAYFVIMI